MTRLLAVLLTLGASGVLGGAPVAPAVAQGFPSRTITIVSPGKSVV